MFRGASIVINPIPSLWLTNFHSLYQLWFGDLNKTHFKSVKYKEIFLRLYKQLKAIYYTNY